MKTSSKKCVLQKKKVEKRLSLDLPIFSRLEKMARSNKMSMPKQVSFLLRGVLPPCSLIGVLPPKEIINRTK